jgi:FKBP-type peptidyl-prolyl cis-trans isomerase
VRSLPPLQYTIVRPGVGELPEPGKLVTIDYTTWLGGFDNGAPYDASKKGGKDTPLRAIVGNSPPSLVAGLDECLLSKMPVGEKRRVVIPPKLAGQGNVLGAMQVPAGETLYVEVRLRSISLNTPGLSTIGLTII